MLRRKPMEPKSGRRAVAQTSPATGRIRCGEQVCRVAGFQTSGPLDFAHRADLEIGDTAGLENCATILGTPWLFSTRFVIVRLCIS
jgi:hypothetical protein